MPRFNLTPGHSSCASKVWTSCWVVARICRGPDSGPRLIRHEADGLAGSFRNLHPIKLLFVLWHLKWWDARGRGQGIEEGGVGERVGLPRVGRRGGQVRGLERGAMDAAGTMGAVQR